MNGLDWLWTVVCCARKARDGPSLPGFHDSARSPATSSFAADEEKDAATISTTCSDRERFSGASEESPEIWQPQSPLMEEPSESSSAEPIDLEVFLEAETVQVRSRRIESLDDFLA
ncbi:unnamed protein product [Effrenium voratum]|nr:unnamed protein product [Effrenium voratum]